MNILKTKKRLTLSKIDKTAIFSILNIFFFVMLINTFIKDIKIVLWTVVINCT